MTSADRCPGVLNMVFNGTYVRHTCELVGPHPGKQCKARDTHGVVVASWGGPDEAEPGYVPFAVAKYTPFVQTEYGGVDWAGDVHDWAVPAGTPRYAKVTQ